ncbi:MAG: hypothetical protein AAB490_01720 [Patescibacteria group bacterium]
MLSIGIPQYSLLWILPHVLLLLWSASLLFCGIQLDIYRRTQTKHDSAASMLFMLGGTLLLTCPKSWTLFAILHLPLFLWGPGMIAATTIVISTSSVAFLYYATFRDQDLW